MNPRVHIVGEIHGRGHSRRLQREKKALQEKLAGLIVPGVDAAKEAGKLLEDLPSLWSKASLSERRKLLMTMLDAVYVDLNTKQMVALRPKPALRPLFEVAVMREGSGITLIPDTKENVTDVESATDSAPCFWWRRGRVGLCLKHGAECLTLAA